MTIPTATKTPVGAGGEIQPTDAIDTLIESETVEAISYEWLFTRLWR
ncbi:putative orphan protein [Pseudoalteromonas translucida]|uniref:Orphan protein n=1 Tax=Pseudoalteromonas translucida (strain TAC 125) TaxID=326442 RepID=Q3IIE9_PSET1|nr:putative orphan protein [Pseudoalteromonas translucida]